MLLEKLKQAKRNLGRVNIESNMEGLSKNTEEEVVLGHDYIDDNSDYSNRPDLEGEALPITDPESPNDLDPDYDLEKDPRTMNLEKFTTTGSTPKFTQTTTCPEHKVYDGCPVKIEDKEESMDKLEELNKITPIEDTSGKTTSHITNFLEKYAEGNDIIQVLRTDLMKVLSDMQWIVESDNRHEQWALDFADALNEISIAI